MIRWIDSLRRNNRLDSDGYRALLECDSSDVLEYLRREAQQVAELNFGRHVYIRALIEITNRCRNNCFYCGIRAANSEVARYSLSHDEILACCAEGYRLGFRTFVLQGGEDPAMSDGWVLELVVRIRSSFPDCAITLSLGERSRECYEQWFEGGANRYLLRHESHNDAHYRRLHPERMSLDNRLQCIEWLKEIGYQTGTGIMVGSPYQTIDNLIEDLQYIEQLQPQMIGIGPFVAHHATPFADHNSGSVEMTLKLISILRLISPQALIPSTTALATISDDGRERGILAGANVVMPNLTPMMQRSKYSLYDNKASYGVESAEGLELLAERFEKIGYNISYNRGDSLIKK